ncbi:MAG: hypothetical protein RLZZ387_2820 [Chloroflexota bacterium]|jgi:hypothetical protein
MRLQVREVVGLALLLAAMGGFWLWQQQQAVPQLPGATVVEDAINGGMARAITLQSSMSEEEVRAFYRSNLPGRGWVYCGTQATPGCTNVFMALAGEDVEIDVYRRADDTTRTGRTVEVWVQPQESRTRVVIYESSEQP